MRFAICNEIFAGWKLNDIFGYAAKIGYDAVEIAPFTIARYVTEITTAQREEIRANARAHGIAISGIHWVLAQTEGLHLTHREAAVRKRTAQYLADLVSFCGDLGGRYMIVGSPKQRNLAADVTPQQGRAWAGEVFGEGLLRAREREVTICFEPLAPTETNFINTAQEAIQFLKEVSHPNFKMILDVKAMSSESRPIPEIIQTSVPHFAYFHANDKNLKGPGFGSIDFKPIAAALRQAHYNGYVSVEVFNFDEGPEMIATRSLETLQRAFA